MEFGAVREMGPRFDPAFRVLLTGVQTGGEPTRSRGRCWGAAAGIERLGCVESVRGSRSGRLLSEKVDVWARRELVMPMA